MTEPRSAEEWAREFLASDGFALWVRGEADTGYLEGLLGAELTRFAVQERTALQQRVEALEKLLREIDKAAAIREEDHQKAHWRSTL